MLKLLIGKDWLSNRNEIFKRITQDVHARRDHRVLLVPELISHEYERLLCASAGDTSSRYAEVLSFTRLVQRVADYCRIPVFPCLDNGGRMAAMAAVTHQLSSRLKAYASIETKPEFLNGLIEAVDEFKRCCISARDLSQAAKNVSGNFAQKLEELSLIMECYDTLCAKGKRDPRDQITWLLEQLEESDFAETHSFYIDGFPDFTRQNLAVISHLIKYSPNVTISLNCDQIGSGNLAFEKAGNTAKIIYQIAQQAGIEVSVEAIAHRSDVLTPVREKIFQGSISELPQGKYLMTGQCESPFDECMAVLRDVLHLVQDGCRYRDIAVVCTDLDTYRPLMDLIFHRHHIPLYCTGTENILQKSVVSTVVTALDAALSDFEPKTMMRYLRSALAPLDPDKCDVLENYIIQWGIRGQKWTHTWEYHPEGLGCEWNPSYKAVVDSLNEDRITAVNPLINLRKAFQKASSVCDQVQAIAEFLEAIQLERRLADLALEMDNSGDNRSAQVLNQLWEILLTALEQLYDILGNTHWEAEHFTKLFRLLLSQYDVGTIPPVLDAVQMGAMSSMRCNAQKHLFILGAEEGKLPGYSGSAGVLTDQERTALRELGVPLTGGAVEGIQAEFADIFGVISGATEAIHIYCSGNHPSFIFRRLAHLSGSTETFNDRLGFSMADDVEACAFLSRFNGIKAAQSIGIEQTYEEVRKRSQYDLGLVSSENIQGLYGKTLNLSASQIDRMAECRLSYFLKYGLRAKERKEITVDPAEFGTYVHSVLENTARCVQELGGFHKVSLEETLKLAHQYGEEYAQERFGQIESERMVYLFKRNVQELDMIVMELWQELSISEFEPNAFEVGFGDAHSLPPIAIPNRAMNALLRGFIDRVDVWKSPGSSYYRVVDYKTGKKDFDYCDVFNGIGLQMLIYLFALRTAKFSEADIQLYPAGVQYFPARVPYLPTEGMIDDDTAEKERRAYWKRKGLLLRDEAVLQAMEPGDHPVRLSYTVRKDGTYSGDLADRDQMRMLEQYIFRFLGKLVEEIASGQVEPNPYMRGSSHSACAFCPYNSVCREKAEKGCRNYKAMSAQRFWEEIEKEMQKNG